jgi:hypothetical protein
MMTALAIETMLIGLDLGLRFNVLVLVPATVIGSAFAIAKAWRTATTFGLFYLSWPR